MSTLEERDEELQVKAMDIARMIYEQSSTDGETTDIEAAITLLSKVQLGMLVGMVDEGCCGPEVYDWFIEKLKEARELGNDGSV